MNKLIKLLITALACPLILPIVIEDEFEIGGVERDLADDEVTE